MNVKLFKRINLLLILTLSFSNLMLGQNNLITTNPNFLTGLNGWSSVGAVNFLHNPQGSITTGSAEVEVLATAGNAWSTQLMSDYYSIPDSVKNELLYLSVYVKSLSNEQFRVQIQTQDTAGNVNNDNSVYFNIDTSFQLFCLPVRFTDADTSFRVRFQIGLDTGTFFFDDVSLNLIPFDVVNVEQFDHWVSRDFVQPTLTSNQTLSKGVADINVSIQLDDTIAPVLPTQFGVNSNIRSTNSLVGRSDLYEEFGSFRFPAGSGSNRYFWDCNIPTSTAIPVTSLCGTASQFLDIPNFLQFKQNAQGEATVVVNYFYARYGITASGTREDRVAQAAAYAASFVREMNVNLNANIKYWEIGNECYGSWETGYDVNGSIVTGKEYGEDLRVFADSMRAVDATIFIGAVLSTNDFNWNSQVLKEVENDADFLILHHYFDNVQSGSDAEVAATEIREDMEAVQNMVAKYTSKPAGYFPIAYTEYNNRGDHETTISNGLFIADAIGAIIESRFFLATIWVNEWNISGFQSKGLLAVNDFDQQDYTPRPSYTPYYYYDKCFGDQLISSSVTGNDNQKIYTSKFNSGEIGVVVINYADAPKTIKFELPNTLGLDTAFWYSVYADDKVIGNKKFYVNGLTSTTVGGGPANLDTVPAYVSILTDSSIISVPKLSANYFVLKPLQATTNVNVNNFEKNNLVLIYPNPTKGTVILEGIPDELERVQLFNLYGQEIFIKVNEIGANQGRKEIDLSRLPEGIYLVKTKNTINKIQKL